MFRLEKQQNFWILVPEVTRYMQSGKRLQPSFFVLLRSFFASLQEQLLRRNLLFVCFLLDSSLSFINKTASHKSSLRLLSSPARFVRFLMSKETDKTVRPPSLCFTSYARFLAIYRSIYREKTIFFFFSARSSLSVSAPKAPKSYCSIPLAVPS